MFLLLVACTARLPATETPTPLQARAVDAMATRFTLLLPAGADADRGLALVEAELRRVETQANEWQEGSPLAALNAAAGAEPVAVPPDLEALLRRALALAEQTGGAFDPTWAALWGLWDFRSPSPSLPEPQRLAEHAARVGWRGLEVQPGQARLSREGMAVGLGGIAKGWALDHAAAALEQAGYTAFSLSAGGQVLVRGQPQPGRPWRVGVRDPRGPENEAFLVLGLERGSVSTSGDYERFFVVDGTRYHHILDPRTGWPARGLRSATVLAPDATTADALSTAAMVLGPERAMDLADPAQGVELLLVDEAGGVRLSPGAEARVLERREPRPAPGP